MIPGRALLTKAPSLKMAVPPSVMTTELAGEPKSGTTSWESVPGGVDTSIDNIVPVAGVSLHPTLIATFLTVSKQGSPIVVCALAAHEVSECRHENRDQAYLRTSITRTGPTTAGEPARRLSNTAR